MGRWLTMPWKAMASKDAKKQCSFCNSQHALEKLHMSSHCLICLWSMGLSGPCSCLLICLHISCLPACLSACLGLSCTAGLGYYRRARYLLDGAKYIVRELGGSFPTTAKQLLSIPGGYVGGM